MSRNDRCLFLLCASLYVQETVETPISTGLEWNKGPGSRKAGPWASFVFRYGASGLRFGRVA
jgi:hypothetical protein